MHECVYICVSACVRERDGERRGVGGVFYFEAYFFLNPCLCFCLCWPVHVNYWTDCGGNAG